MFVSWQLATAMGKLLDASQATDLCHSPGRHEDSISAPIFPFLIALLIQMCAFYTGVFMVNSFLTRQFHASRCMHSFIKLS